MDSQTVSLIGTCRCGQTEFEVSAAPLITSACHCRGCQQMSSSAYGLHATVPADAFRVTRGEPVKGGLQGPKADHYFCPFCKSWMFTRIPGFDQIVNVRSVLLDDPKWSKPFVDMMTSEKLDWVETTGAHSFEGFPPPEDFFRLIEEFAAAEVAG